MVRRYILINHVCIEKHKNDILDIKYYHIALYLPKKIYPLFYYNQKITYDLLFKVSSDVVLETNYQHLGINVGITSILHSWSQKEKNYPYIHMLVTGRGINKLGKENNVELDRNIFEYAEDVKK